MLLNLTADQEFFRDTTAKFLADQAPAELLQRMAGSVPADWEASYWRRGAELGWTSLLVSEEAGGGSISGRGLVDLSLIAHEFGHHAAPGPLLPANVAAAALSDAGTHAEVLAELVAGTAIAAWCHAEPRGAAEGRVGPFDVALDIRPDGTDLVLNGVKRPVEAAGTARYLLVTGCTAGRLTQVLVPSDAPGVTITPLRTADYSRHFAAVTFTDVRVPGSAVVGEVGGAAGQAERQLQLALVIAAAEMVGAMQAGFDMTLALAFDRYSFGRPLASYRRSSTGSPT
jgi:alkylation response protein AidB-like acyl-CoA dehydrogenase